MPKVFYNLERNQPMISEQDVILILTNPDRLDIFKRIITSAIALGSAAKDFPKYKGKLIQLVINSSERLMHVLKGGGPLSLSVLAMYFFEHKDELIQMSFSNPEIFECLIPRHSDLVNFVKHFPEHEKQLIKLVLYNPEQFKRLIPTSFALSSIAQNFYKYSDIFFARTVGQAIKSLKSEAEIGKNARVIYQGVGPNQNSFFKRLPDELNIKIAGLTADGTLYEHDKHRAEQIASEHYSRISYSN